MLELRADGHHDIWTAWANIYVPQMSTVNVNLYYAATLRICQHMNICISKKKINKVKIQNQKTEPTFFRPGLLVPVLFWALSPNRDWVTVLRKLVFLPRIQRSGSRGSQVFITLFSHSSMWVSLICWRLRWCCLVQSNPNQTNPIHFVRSFVCHSHLICFLG